MHTGAQQEAATDAALTAVREFLGGPNPDGDGWTFDFGAHLDSNWGAVFGGALAAGTLTVARRRAPDRSPRSLHVQIVRSVPPGPVHASARLRHEGRTVTTVEVEITDARGKAAVIGLVTMINPEAVAAELHDTSATPYEIELAPVVVPESREAPITDALGLPNIVDGVSMGMLAENVRPNVDGSLAFAMGMTVPWAELECTGPEAACLLADALLGGALVASSTIPLEAAGPNADLSLRFTTAPAVRRLVGSASMVSVQHGTATVMIEVQAGEHQLAHGLTTSLLLPPR